MADYILQENRNPVIGPKQPNGKQEIGVHDFDSGNRRYITTDSEKVDEFISNRKNTLKKATIVGAVIATATTIAGALFGKNIADKVVGDLLEENLIKIVMKSISAMSGAVFGLIVGIIPAELLYKHTDKKVTQEFINQNK